MFKVSVQSSGSSAGGRHEPEGTVPSLLEPPVHTQDSLLLTNQSLPLTAQIHARVKTSLLLVKCGKTKGEIL